MKIELNGDEITQELTEDSVARLVDAFIEGDSDSFIIMSSSELSYIQACKLRNGSYALERQDGSEEEHWTCSEKNLSREQLLFAFKSYFQRSSSWVQQFSWERLELESSDSSEGSFEIRAWHMGVLLAVVFLFLVWSLIKTFA